MNAPIIIKFLKALSKNNDRDWFEKHKADFIKAKDEFQGFVSELLESMIKFDPGLMGLDPKKLTFRIYRDVRFSKDKSPFKTNMGATFSAGGKLMTKPGYYFHLEPGNKSFVAGGLYMPSPEHITKIRQEIDYNGKGLENVLSDKKFKKLFNGFDEFDKLKKVPKGYPPDHAHLEWLKLKSFIVSHKFTDEEVMNKKFLTQASRAFEVMKPLNEFLGNAVG